MTAGSSMHAMMRIGPPQAVQVSMSMPNTRFNRFAQVIALRCSAGVRASAFAASALPLPRPALVTNARPLPVLSPLPVLYRPTPKICQCGGRKNVDLFNFRE